MAETTTGETPTLYDWAGGLEALERLTEAFYREVVKDPLLEPLFGRMDPGAPAVRRDVAGGGVRRSGDATPSSAAATPTC